jgi:hypothetical protein
MMSFANSDVRFITEWEARFYPLQSKRWNAFEYAMN